MAVIRLWLLCLVSSASRALVTESSSTSKSASNPLLKVIELLRGLSQKVTSYAEVEERSFREYANWCASTSKGKQFELTTLGAQLNKQKALIEAARSDIEVSDAKINELANSIAKAESDLKEATDIREKEGANFAAAEKELFEVVDTLARARDVLAKENGTALLQTGSGGPSGVIDTLGVVIDAASISVSSKGRLLELLQAHSSEYSEESNGDEAVDAPAAVAYSTHSKSILDLLDDLKEKAEAQLSQLRANEVEAKHTYEMLKQSLTDQLDIRNKEIADEKTDKARSGESLAATEKDEQLTLEDYKTSKASYETMQSSCVTVASNFEKSQRQFQDELKVIQKAVDILNKITGEQVNMVYSFVQVSSMVESGNAVVRSHIVSFVRNLAKQHHSKALAQLASRIQAVAMYSASSGEDPFAKVKGLVKNLITKLESEASEEAKEDAFCTKEMSKTESQKEDMSADLKELATRIEQEQSRSMTLKSEVSDMQVELRAMQDEANEMTAIRQHSNKAFLKAKEDLTNALLAVRKAIQVLRDYYAKDEGQSFLQQDKDDDDASFAAFLQQPAKPQSHVSSGGAGDSLIGILQVVESDIAESLAAAESKESSRQERYETLMKKNAISAAATTQDQKYKSQEFLTLDKRLAELLSDKDTLSAENAAVLKYLTMLQERCVVKPETYNQRKDRRAAEIQGLQQALATLQSQAVLLQRRGHRRAAEGNLAPEA